MWDMLLPPIWCPNKDPFLADVSKDLFLANVKECLLDVGLEQVEPVLVLGSYCHK